LARARRRGVNSDHRKPRVEDEIKGIDRRREQKQRHVEKHSRLVVVGNGARVSTEGLRSGKEALAFRFFSHGMAPRSPRRL